MAAQHKIRVLEQIVDGPLGHAVALQHSLQLYDELFQVPGIPGDRSARQEPLRPSGSVSRPREEERVQEEKDVVRRKGRSRGDGERRIGDGLEMAGEGV